MFNIFIIYLIIYVGPGSQSQLHDRTCKKICPEGKVFRRPMTVKQKMEKRKIKTEQIEKKAKAKAKGGTKKKKKKKKKYKKQKNDEL